MPTQTPHIKKLLDAINDALQSSHAPESPIGKKLIELDRLGVGGILLRGSGVFHLYKGSKEDAILRDPSDIDLIITPKKGRSLGFGDKIKDAFKEFVSEVATEYHLDFDVERDRSPSTLKSKVRREFLGEGKYTVSPPDKKDSFKIEVLLDNVFPKALPMDESGQYVAANSLLKGSGLLISNPLNEMMDKIQSLENTPDYKTTARLLDLYNTLCLFPEREISEKELASADTLFSSKSYYFKSTLFHSLRHLDINLPALLHMGRPAYPFREPDENQRTAFHQGLVDFAQQGIISHVPTREKSDQILDTAFILGVFVGRDTKSQARI